MKPTPIFIYHDPTNGPESLLALRLKTIAEIYNLEVVLVTKSIFKEYDEYWTKVRSAKTGVLLFFSFQEINGPLRSKIKKIKAQFDRPPKAIVITSKLSGPYSYKDKILVVSSRLCEHEFHHTLSIVSLFIKVKKLDKYNNRLLPLMMVGIGLHQLSQGVDQV